ncbi:MAG TPA: GNAT family N-acetyltransferase [Blastocatellia bacterium]|nr:GNAT family N-acetyltransferase [Blastocatellia bacterium]
MSIRIETARLVMRPFATGDIDELYRLWIDPGVRKFLWDDQIIPRETAVAVVESSIDSFETHGFGIWTICFKDDPRLIGFCGLRHFTEDVGEKTEDGGENTEDVGEKTEDGGENTEDVGEKTEDGGENTEDGGENTEDGGENTEDGGENTEDGGENTEDVGENKEVEILYGVAPENWGKGIALEAAREALRYGFEVLNLANIYAGADPPNAASFRVIEKLGMKFARKTVVNGLEAIYYVMSHNDYKIHFELDSKIGLK